MIRVLYPGSFDPITKGHMNIIEQASTLFDEVVVAVLVNPFKKGMFTIEERVKLIEKLYADYENVKVVTSTEKLNATTDIALHYNCKAIVRGLRGVTDFDYEITLAGVNKQISANKVNTICLFADSAYQYVSSSITKEVFNLGKDINYYADPLVVEAMKLKKENDESGLNKLLNKEGNKRVLKKVK